MTVLDEYTIYLSQEPIFQREGSRTLDLSKAQGYKTSMLSRDQIAESRTSLLIMDVYAYTGRPQAPQGFVQGLALYDYCIYWESSEQAKRIFKSSIWFWSLVENKKVKHFLGLELNLRNTGQDIRGGSKQIAFWNASRVTLLILSPQHGTINFPLTHSPLTAILKMQRGAWQERIIIMGCVWQREEYWSMKLYSTVVPMHQIY